MSIKAIARLGFLWTCRAIVPDRRLARLN